MSAAIDEYNNISSAWIDYVGVSSNHWNDTNGEPWVIVAVHYTNQTGYTNGELWFWAHLEDYQELVTAESVGSIYWRLWSVYGMKKIPYYIGQDILYKKTDDGENTGGTESFTSDDLEEQQLKDGTFAIDGNLLREALTRKEDGTYEEWKETNDEQTIEKLDKMVNKMSGAMDLLEKSSEIRQLLATEQLTIKKMFKLLFTDIQGMFGVSISKKIQYQLLSSISVGKLNPAMFVKYKYQIKQLYTAIEKDGIAGAAKIGQRWMSAHNPLVRNRYAYKGKMIAKELGLLPKERKIYTGNEALKQISRFHKQVLREERNGFLKRNSLNLEKVINKKTGELGVAWSKTAKNRFGSKILDVGEKIAGVAQAVFPVAGRAVKYGLKITDKVLGIAMLKPKNKKK